MTIAIRPAAPRDRDRLTEMRHALWPEGPVDEHGSEVDAYLAGTPPTTMPLAIVVAESDGDVVGFAEVGLRSHADGCDPVRPAGYLEGWFVEPEHRRRGIGRALVAAAEEWARAQGCTEMASDALIDNEASERAHGRLGYEVVERCVKFRKSL